jgi:hypothetical protein
MIIIAGPVSACAASGKADSVVMTRRSSIRLAFSTSATGVEPDRPAAIKRAAIIGAVERPM